MVFVAAGSVVPASAGLMPVRVVTVGGAGDVAIMPVLSDMEMPAELRIKAGYEQKRRKLQVTA